jgi:formamidopyrimidine-DNA glycosylase
MLGEVRFEKDISSFLEKRNYGPDAMDDSLDKKTFKDLLKDRKGTIKSVLMNQELVSGIGNEFSDEILFHSQIHPKTKVQDLAQKQVEKIYEQMRVVLQKAIDHNTNYDELKDSFLLAHRDKNGMCPKCHSKLNTINVSGRTAYFCPKCQPIA